MSDSIKNVAGFNYRYTGSGKKVRTGKAQPPAVKDEVTISKEKPIRDDSKELAKMANKTFDKTDKTESSPGKNATGKPEGEKENENKGFWSRLFKVGAGATVASTMGLAGATIGLSIGAAKGMATGLAVGAAIAGPVGGALGMVIGMTTGIASGFFTGGLIGTGLGALFGTVVAAS